LNAVSFVAVVIALLLMRRPAVRKSRPEGRVLTQFREAIRYARGRSGILVAYVVTAVVCGLGYPAFQLASVFTRRVYHVGPGLYGVLTGSFGVGALVGAGVLATAGKRSSRSDVVRVAVAVLGLALVGLGLSRSVSEGAVLLAVMGACSLVAIAVVNTTIQVQVPEHLRGRVLALWVVSYTLSYPVGSLVQGWAADHAGPGPTVLVAGLLVCAVASLLVMRPLIARSLDEDLAPAPPAGVLIPGGALAAPPFQDQP
jgi:predicted MFS family arabinose efflux permease